MHHIIIPYSEFYCSYLCDILDFLLLVEKRRRSLINAKIAELGNLLPEHVDRCVKFIYF